MKKYEQLELAIRIATKAHKGQFDKGGKPYILHPLHLMHQLMYDPVLATIAVLHDVIEDSDTALQGLKVLGFSPRVLEALDLLTHKKGVSYSMYIAGVSTSLDAIKVKRKDLEHNSDITRLKGVTKKDLERIEKYHRAFLFLGEGRMKFV
jgi:(p)ppGpp synthase/HD superfamily hydrolase